MYTITVEGRFTAAHRHRGVPGEGLHGHDFLVLARVTGPELADDVLVDFHAVEVELGRILGELTHQDLSTHLLAGGGSATPAALARWIFERLAPCVGATAPVVLGSVEVRDTDSTGALYAPDPPGRPARGEAPPSVA